MSATCTVKAEAALVVGVPDTVPPIVAFSPFGSEPALMLHE
jgi:hypothetical protein